MESGPFWSDLRPNDPEYAVRLVDRMLSAAVKQRASDIHLHPRSDHWEILFRLDGALCAIGRVPRSSLTDPATRLMVLANIPTYKSGQPMETRCAGNRRMRVLQTTGSSDPVAALALPANFGIEHHAWSNISCVKS